MCTVPIPILPGFCELLEIKIQLWIKQLKFEIRHSLQYAYWKQWTVPISSRTIAQLYLEFSREITSK